MKLGVPWHIKGVHPNARVSAREAARRAGMSVGEWLNSVILESSEDAEQGPVDEQGHRDQVLVGRRVKECVPDALGRDSGRVFEVVATDGLIAADPQQRGSRQHHGPGEDDQRDGTIRKS